MRQTAEAFAAVLVKHHNRICKPRSRTEKAVTDADIKQCVITYGDLCRQAGMGIPMGSGIFLGEIHRLCQNKGLPPINALVVNGRTLMPGPNYPGKNWAQDINRCIAARYPARFW